MGRREGERKAQQSSRGEWAHPCVVRNDARVVCARLESQTKDEKIRREKKNDDHGTKQKHNCGKKKKKLTRRLDRVKVDPARHPVVVERDAHVHVARVAPRPVDQDALLALAHEGYPGPGVLAGGFSRLAVDGEDDFDARTEHFVEGLGHGAEDDCFVSI